MAKALKSRGAKAKAPAAKGRVKAPLKSSKASKPKASSASDVDPALFLPLTAGEVADATRLLIEDRRVSSMAKVGRYRIISTEPLVLKPPHVLAGHRLARLVAYDYSADRAVDALLDLDAGTVAHLETSRAQPMLSRDEEAAAAQIALADEQVQARLQLGDEPVLVTHYWSRTASEQAASRRSAAVLLGRPGAPPSLVAVVDLLDAEVTQVVAAAAW